MSLRLEIDGEVYEGWHRASVVRSLEEFCPSFVLSYVDRWYSASGSWPIFHGAACTLYEGNHILITGFVNRAAWSIKGAEYSLTAEGRSRTQDLVDCSATHAAGQWRQRTLVQIATELCEPFGISASLALGADTAKFRRFVIEEGESVHDAIMRMSTLRGLLPVSTVAGDLEFLDADLLYSDPQTRTITVDLGTVIERTLETDDQNRYSEYRLRAQTGGSKEFSGKLTSAQRFEAEDDAVERFRPMVIVGQGPGHRKELEAQARYERNIRAGQSAALHYTMPGILAPDGEPWAPGMLCRVRDQQLLTDRTLLVSHVEHTVDSTSATTRIKMVKHESFSTNDFPARDRKAIV